MRTPVLIAVLALFSLPLGACGFTPLYATPGVTPSLQSVEVTTPRGSKSYEVVAVSYK